MEIDIVYLWVDGNDPVWQAKRNAFIGGTDESSPINCKGRYANNDELKYSLRSIEMYAPWIRKIFIVTDNQIPEWLDTLNPKIQIVDHKEFMPEESLPCFNSNIIEHYLYRISGLSEFFLLANDDTFINQKVTPNSFYTSDGFPIIRQFRKPFRKIRWFWHEHIRQKPLENYRRIIHRASLLVEKSYGKYYTGMPHHNIDAYRKRDFQQVVEEDFRDEFMANDKNHMRNDNDIPRCIISYIALARKRGKLKYVTDKESVNLKIQKKEHYQKITKEKTIFFCLNDTEHAQDSDRIKARDFLEERFPNKSKFEK